MKEVAVESGSRVAAWTDHASKVYGKGDSMVVALDEVTIDFPEGHLTAVMGPSGSGKSTLMHCAAGLDTLSSGRTFIGEVELGSLSERELTRLRRECIGFVFQTFNLVPTLSALENIMLPVNLSGTKVDQPWLDTVIDVVRIGDRLSHRPSELSGGQQQRVAIARALASRPQIIFADEPTGNLDSRSGAEILGFMRHAVSNLGQTIVMVTHDPVAASYADSAVVLVDGRIVDQIAEPNTGKIFEYMRALEG